MIARIWHGWTTPDNADAYETLLREKIFPDIEAMDIPGYRSIELLRRVPAEGSEEVEHITIMTFDSLDSVRSFVGEDYARAHVPEEARRVLSRFDERSQHYEIRERRQYD